MNGQTGTTVNRRIAGAAFIIFIGNVVGFTFSFFKEILVAAKYGVGYEMDVFYAASSLPNLISGAVLSIFAAIFIPILIEFKVKEKEEVQKILNGLITYILLGLLVLSLLLYFLSPLVIRVFFPGFSGSVSALAIRVSQLLVLTIVFTCLTGILTGILHTEKHFTAPAFSGLAVTLCTIAAVYFLRDKIGVFALGWGLVLGTLLQFLILIPVLRRRGYRFGLLVYLDNPALKQARTVLLPFMFGMVIAELSPVVGRMMSSELQAGSIAALGYALKLAGVPLLFFSSSIVTAVFPFFATQVAEEKTEEMKESLAISLRMASYMAIPITVLLCVLAQPLIHLIYERGHFTAQATALTAATFRMYCLQIYFYTGFLVMSRVFLSYKKINYLVFIGVISLLLNVIFNWLFMRWLDPPVTGIALATSLVYAIGFLVSFIYLKKLLPHLNGRYIIDGAVKVTLASLLMGAVSLGLYKYMISGCPSAKPYLMLVLLISGGTGLALYVAMVSWLKIDEQRRMLSLIKEKVWGALYDREMG